MQRKLFLVWCRHARPKDLKHSSYLFFYCGCAPEQNRFFHIQHAWFGTRVQRCYIPKQSKPVQWTRRFFQDMRAQGITTSYGILVYCFKKLQRYQFHTNCMPIVELYPMLLTFVWRQVRFRFIFHVHNHNINIYIYISQVWCYFMFFRHTPRWCGL